MTQVAAFPILFVAAVALMTFGSSRCKCDAFIAASKPSHVMPHRNDGSHQTFHKLSSSPEETQEIPPQANLVNKDAFVTAIDILKRDMGVETDPEVDSMLNIYAIGRLEAKIPLNFVSGIRFADCETLTLISGLKQGVADETGIQPLDTIVAIRAGSDGHGGYGYEGETSGVNLEGTAAMYTAAIKYAMENKLNEIQLEVNRLVPIVAASE